LYYDDTKQKKEKNEKIDFFECDSIQSRNNASSSQIESRKTEIFKTTGTDNDGAPARLLYAFRFCRPSQRSWPFFQPPWQQLKHGTSPAPQRQDKAKKHGKNLVPAFASSTSKQPPPLPLDLLSNRRDESERQIG